MFCQSYVGQTWVGTRSVKVKRKSAEEELGGNVFRQSWVGTRSMKVGWEGVSPGTVAGLARRAVGNGTRLHPSSIMEK